MRTVFGLFLLPACTWIVAGAVAFTTSACGGGDPDTRLDAGRPDAPAGNEFDAVHTETPIANPNLDGAATAVDLAPSTSPYCTSKPALPGVIDLTGTWVTRVIGAIIVEAPFIGLVRQQMVLTLLVDVTQQGQTLIADGRYCNREQKSEPGALTQVIIPDAWAHTETPLQRPGTYAFASDGTPVVVFTAMPETMGAVLASPGTEPLPVAADDPRVIDQDNDGNPGITVSLTGLSLSGQIYAVQRQITSFTGIPVSASRIEGAVTFTTEQTVLGSNPSNLATLYAMAGQSGADPTACSSTFTMVKLADVADGGAVTCEWVRASESSLFGP